MRTPAVSRVQSLWWLRVALTSAALLSLVAAELECECHLRSPTQRAVNIVCADAQSADMEAGCFRGERMTSKVPAPRYVDSGFLFLPPHSLVKMPPIFAPWEEAQRICRSIGSDLFVPPDENSVSLLTKSPFESFITEQYFIGISDLQVSGYYVAIDGKPAPFLRWREGEPNSLAGYEHCLSLGRDGLMNDLPCGEYRRFLCERRLRRPPPQGYRYVPAAGAFLRLSEERRPHAEAAVACSLQEGDGGLFVPDSLRRVEALLRVVPVDAGDLLVGLTYARQLGVFVTDSGRLQPDMEFDGWLRGQPDGGGDCVVLHSHGFLADVNCSEPRRYVCEWLP